MSEITKAMIRGALGELKLSIGIYKNKHNGELGAMVDSINNHNFVFNASVWEKQQKIFVEGTNRIREMIVDELDSSNSNNAKEE